MKIKLTIVLLFICFGAFAQIPISRLPNLTGSPKGGVLPIVKNGSNYKIYADSIIVTKIQWDSILNKPVIPAPYTLPTASATVLGGIKVGNNLTISAGVLSSIQIDTSYLSFRINNKVDLYGSYSNPAWIVNLPYSKITGTPTIPAQFNPIAGTNITLSGTYPNITFAATGSASYWTATGNDIYNNNSGFVGIGLNAPTALLHVQKTVNTVAGQNRGAYINTTFNFIAGSGGPASVLDIAGTYNNNPGYDQFLIRAGAPPLSSPVFWVKSTGQMYAGSDFTTAGGLNSNSGALYLGVSGGDGVQASKVRYAMKNDYRFSVMNTALNFEYASLAFSQNDIYFGTGSARAWTTFVASKNILFGSSNIDLHPSAKVVIESTTQGFLPPTMTTTQRTAIASPAEGLEVYDLTLHKKFIYDGTTWRALW